ncbi:MAG: hypothetical protein WAM60_20565 [Candidatus Promineifilaceae bacterium]
MDDIFNSAEIVLVARLTKVQPIDEQSAVSDFHFKGKEALKGDLLEEISLRVKEGLGDPGLVGFDYLLFLREGQTQVAACEPALFQMRKSVLMWYSNLRERRNL